MIDTHCHLYLDEFKDDIKDIIERAQKKGVNKFYLPAIDSSETNNMLLLEKKFPAQCIAMMGLHPCSVKEDYQTELQFAATYLKQRKFAAVGEIGLDFHWDKKFMSLQYEAFETQIEWALHYNLPIVIHSRDAMRETIAVVEKYVGRGLRGIFHCFSGSYNDALKIIDAGFFLGIGGVLTYKNAGLAEVIANIGLQYLVLETDAPYLSPVPFRGKRNESSYIQLVAEKLAQIKNISVNEVDTVTTQNAEKIFGL